MPSDTSSGHYSKNTECCCYLRFLWQDQTTLGHHNAHYNKHTPWTFCGEGGRKLFLGGLMHSEELASAWWMEVIVSIVKWRSPPEGPLHRFGVGFRGRLQCAVGLLDCFLRENHRKDRFHQRVSFCCTEWLLCFTVFIVKR